MAFIIDDLLKGIGKKKAAKEEYRAASEQFGQKERSRVWNNQAKQAMLRSLFGGRYALPESTFSDIQTVRPYAGPDTSKGVMWDAMGNVAESGGKMVAAALAPHPAGPPASSVDSGGVVQDLQSMGMPASVAAGNFNFASTPLTPYPAAPSSSGGGTSSDVSVPGVDPRDYFPS